MLKRLVYLTTTLLLFGFMTGVQAQEEASAASLYNSGLEKIKAKEYAEGLALMDQAIEKADPESETDAKVIKLAKRNGAIAAYYAGKSQAKKDDLEGALATYDKGIDYNPGFYANYIGRAQTLEKQGQITEAIGAYVKAGEVSEKGKKADKAEKMYSKAENIVALEWGDKKWASTIEYAEAFLAADRETAEVHYYLASALKASDQETKAIEHAEKAIALAAESDADKYLFLKAECLESTGQKEAAVEAYKEISDAKYAERAQYKVKELTGEN